jgi:hypothetical protein
MAGAFLIQLPPSFFRKAPQAQPCPDPRRVMFPFKRIHDGGTEAILKPGADGWSIQINLKEPNRSCRSSAISGALSNQPSSLPTKKFSNTAMSATRSVRDGKNFSLFKNSRFKSSQAASKVTCFPRPKKIDPGLYNRGRGILRERLTARIVIHHPA